MRHLTLIIFAVLATRCVYLDGAPTDDAEQAEFFQTVDELIERETLEDLNEAKRLLLERSEKNGDTSSLLWRLASYYLHCKSINKDLPKDERLALIETGLGYAEKALELDESDPDAHKWFGLLTGARGEFMGWGEQVRGGIVLKNHIDIAIQSRPDDPSFHHLIGIIGYEVGKLSWLQRNMAKAMFEELPNLNVDNAIESFLLADKHSKKPWKSNCVYLVKCYLYKNQLPIAKKWLDVAEQIEIKTREDKKAAKEIVQLRKKL